VAVCARCMRPGRPGSITKAGPPHARRLLVEAAWHYRHRPAIGQTLAARQHGQDPRIIEIAWRAQRRLNQRWAHLHQQRRKPAGVVAIACARELAGFLWEAATLD
jgi:transposase